MGLKQFLCVDMNPVAAPEMYLCPKLKKDTLMAKAVRYTKVGKEIAPEQVADGAQFTVVPGPVLLSHCQSDFVLLLCCGRHKLCRVGRISAGAVFDCPSAIVG